MKIKITERGWGAHHICGLRCAFRRNTLIEYGRKKIVVSTVGAFRADDKIETVGHNRYYETLAFKAYHDKPYWDADIQKQISLSDFESKWFIEDIDRESDVEANEMHENIVKELSKKIQENNLTFV